MKNKLVLSVLFALLSSSIFAQDSEELIFGTQIWFAKQGLNQKMMKGMEEKTKKFNRGEDATYPMYTFRYRTGRYAGGIERVSARTASNLDSYNNREERQYFSKHVVPYADMSRMVRTKLWARQDDHSYNGSGSDERMKFTQVITYRLKPGSLQWDGLRKKLVEAHEKSGSTARFRSYRLLAGDVTTFGMVIPFNSWEDYTTLESKVFNQDIYDSVHGEGSWADFLEVFTEIVKEREVHLREYLPNLSTE
jgi:hypothetical protein|tara:strand:+ start:260 stop:1009 length:750 start_codon:yes stop_codon:yes gene_type:complete